MTNDNAYATTLSRGFAAALAGLIPQLDLAGIGWKAGDQYDEFDRIADTLFRELVLHPLTHEALGTGKSYQYDMPPYESSWGGLQIFNLKEGNSGPLVRVASVGAPMDSFTYLSSGEEKTVSLTDAAVELVLKRIP